MSESEYSLIQFENESRPVATNQCTGPEFERLCLLHEPQNLCPSCRGSARDEELNGGGRVYDLGDEWYCCSFTIWITRQPAKEREG